MYGSGIYETKEGTDEVVDVDEEDDDGEDRAKPVEGKVRREEVWREMFLTSNGRDKAFVRCYRECNTAISTFLFNIMPETNAIFHPTIPPFPCFIDSQSHAEPTYLSTMGVRTNQTSPIDCVWTIIHEVASLHESPLVSLTVCYYTGNFYYCSTGWGR
jgi:hypothetical protein